MVQRCTDPNKDKWKYYGGRGVSICDRWNPKKGGNFENFLADMGERPEGTSIDKDKLGDGMLYSPETCCWLTKAEQSIYKKNTVIVVYKGVEMPLMKAAEISGLKRSTIYQRIKRGWDKEHWFDAAVYP